MHVIGKLYTYIYIYVEVHFSIEESTNCLLKATEF